MRRPQCRLVYHDQKYMSRREWRTRGAIIPSRFGGPSVEWDNGTKDWWTSHDVFFQTGTNDGLTKYDVDRINKFISSQPGYE